MKFVLRLCMLACAGAAAQEQYPGESWQVVAPEARGWSAEKLAAAQALAETLDTAAVMVIDDGVVVAQWGDTDRLFPIHSMRKSILSALFGPYVGDEIDLDATLAELKIDDKQGLTETEKQATVRHLMTARSGIYHPAAYEPESMKETRPERGSQAPGAQWFYNNWDFNALATIFEQETGRKLFEEFVERIAKPTGMVDYQSRHGRYLYDDDSVHPAYLFIMSARDLARFGWLMASEGRWQGEQLIPAEWIVESTKPVSEAWERGGFGYMWWTPAPRANRLFGVEVEAGAFAATGSGGEKMVILPQSDVVIVHRVNTSMDRDEVSDEDFARLLELILAARGQV